MKNFLVAIIFCLGFSVTAKAQSIDEMKSQREALKLTTDLVDKKIELETENQKNEKIKSNTQSLNRKSDKSTDNFSSSDPDSTVKDAKKTAKILKETENANKDLEKSNRKIIGLQADIKKIESQLDKAKYRIELKEK